MKQKGYVSLAVLVIVAVIIGVVLVNKGDNPINDLIISFESVDNKADYNEMREDDAKVLLFLEKEFNDYVVKKQIPIESMKDLYMNVHYIESKQGMTYTGKFLLEGSVIKEESIKLPTDREGVISYKIEGMLSQKGNWLFQIEYDGEAIFEYSFVIE